MRSYKIILTTTVLMLSMSANAAVISTDWKTVGDNLITYDTTSGLNWLDLTQTRYMTYNDIIQKLGAGQQFDGWRYASIDEISGLWSNFGVDLSGGAYSTVIGNVDPGIVMATEFLGNLTNDWGSPLDNGALGYSYQVDSNFTAVIGGYYDITNTVNRYYRGDVTFGLGAAYNDIGSYLVQDVSAVPVPAAAWLFGSGLIGLAGLARRKA